MSVVRMTVLLIFGLSHAAVAVSDELPTPAQVRDRLENWRKNLVAFRLCYEVRSPRSDVARVRDRFEAWRRTCCVGDRIPERLWSLAVALAAAHGLSRTATVLKLDYYSLRKRVAARSSDSGMAASPFVELRAPTEPPASRLPAEISLRADLPTAIRRIMHIRRIASAAADRRMAPFAIYITRNWQGTPLETLDIVVNLISNTKTQTGLEVHAWIDANEYPDKLKVTDEELAVVNIRRNKFHGEWNYRIIPTQP